jgi:hypothetical protein
LHDPSPEAARAEYRADGAPWAGEAAADIDRLLADVPDEAGLEQWSRRLGNSWHPPHFGLTYREFFERLRDALRA